LFRGASKHAANAVALSYAPTGHASKSGRPSAAIARQVCLVPRISKNGGALMYRTFGCEHEVVLHRLGRASAEPAKNRHDISRRIEYRRALRLAFGTIHIRPGSPLSAVRVLAFERHGSCIEHVRRGVKNLELA
jgi:hypothetical protein